MEKKEGDKKDDSIQKKRGRPKKISSKKKFFN
jgi:hypothetical protein